MGALFWLSDEQWAAIAPHLPKNQPGARRVDDRRVISGILHVLKIGCRWQDCPAEYGPHTTVYNRFNRWARRRFWLKLLEALVEQLALHEEFDAIAVDSGTKAVQAAKGGQVDLVIMDVGLPDVDGREAVRILRKNGFKAPIIMLTGHDTDSDTILGLESGANDYVTKPFRFAVLLARIRAQLRQHEASEDAVFTIGPYSFRPSSKLLLSPKGSKVRLTEKETAILRYLYRAGQKPVSRETLLQEVWGYNSGVTTHTLETHIYRLRQKVEKDAASPSILVTEAGGYKLVP